ncbi:hypothetical protein VTK73DRAFT_8674 [Phialemonium thermophilum]|uniref:Uncharacterized protein n=1 Tax=Phialemonium thermophilum TaxID=223376 RepID=A0ABR3XNV0_9PEZI
MSAMRIRTKVLDGKAPKQVDVYCTWPLARFKIIVQLSISYRPAYILITLPNTASRDLGTLLQISSRIGLGQAAGPDTCCTDNAAGQGIGPTARVCYF